jgi:4a-hydroxytetrahydrobiopterin dehydratase
VSDLSKETCVPCTTDVPALEDAELARLHHQIPDWELVEGHHLKKELRFGNFCEALDFVNQVGGLAEEQGHHPDVGFGWGWAEITVLIPRYKTLPLSI